MEFELKVLEEGICSPRGFRATGVSCGLKDGGYKDIGLLYSEVPCVTAGAYTENRIKASPVLLDIKRKNNEIRAVIVNSGNANCMTGLTGDSNALEMAGLTEKGLLIPEGTVLVSSTGVIGRKLEMDRVRYGIEKLTKLIKSESDYRNFSLSIMTTDKKMKSSAYEFYLSGTPVRIGITVKGSGMIKPRLSVNEELHATMLAFITTDVKIGKDLLSAALEEAVGLSFNRINVDNDTSTNDSVILLSNGLAGNDPIDTKGENYRIFSQVLIMICQNAAKMLVKDGEGATKIAGIKVKNAVSESDAEKIARAISESYLVKTALFGQSPNWGRIFAALGYSGAYFDLLKIKLYFNDLLIFENGDINRANEGRAGSEMISSEIIITLDLGLGNKEYFMWTSDLSCDYVKINAAYLS